MIFNWGCSSAGRASGWQSEGQGFEPPQLHYKLIKIRLRKNGAFFMHYYKSTNRCSLNEKNIINSLMIIQ